MKMDFVVMMIVLNVAIAAIVVASRVIQAANRKNCTASTAAKVVENEGVQLLGKRPFYEYQLGNRVYRSKAAYSSDQTPEVGSFVEVHYDPLNPSQSYLAGYDDKTLKSMMYTMCTAGTAMFFINTAIVMSAFTI